jgi:hypothetical protein
MCYPKLTDSCIRGPSNKGSNCIPITTTTNQTNQTSVQESVDDAEMNPIVQEFIELDVSSKTLPKLTPYMTVLALLVELQILEQSDKSFEKAVYTGLTHVPIQGGQMVLNLHELVEDLYRLFQHNKAKEFSCATFDSLYRTWEKGQYDPNHRLSIAEGALQADAANFTQLFKVLIFLSGEMYKRFFMDYDPRITNTSNAYYTIFSDSDKKKRTSDAFFQFLNDFRPLYMKLNMISPNKAEIRAIYKDAGEQSKILSDKAKAEFRGKPSKADTQKYIRARLEKKAAATFAPAPATSVWKKTFTSAAAVEAEPVAAAEPVAEPVAEAEPVAAEVDDGFVLVQSKKHVPRKYNNTKRK